MMGAWKFLWPFASRLSKTPSPRRRGHVPNADSELTRIAVKLLRGVGCEATAEQVAVVWHHRLTSTAGLARPAQSMVLLNPRLKTFPDEVDRTLRHELAHLVAIARARGRRINAHGPEWKRACVELGIPGESRCHTLPLPRRAVNRKHVYRCPGCGFLLRRVRPIKARRRLACLDCCKRYAGGRFEQRFEFVKVRAAAAEAASHPASPALATESMVQQTFKLLFPMDESTKDKIKGAVNETSGKIKEKIGGATNDPDLQDEGTGEKVKGKVQGKIGDIKKVFEK